MPSPAVQEALAYLDAREADRKAALALSEQKAEEAKLIKAWQEGFQAAMEILGSGTSVRRAGADPKVKQPSEALRLITNSTSPCNAEAGGLYASLSCENCRYLVRS